MVRAKYTMMVDIDTEACMIRSHVAAYVLELERKNTVGMHASIDIRVFACSMTPPVPINVRAYHVK